MKTHYGKTVQSESFPFVTRVPFSKATISNDVQCLHECMRINSTHMEIFIRAV